MAGLLCPMCSQHNEGILIICDVDGQRLAVCEPCFKARQNSPAPSFYEMAKKRAEELRKKQNVDVIRMYRLKPTKR